MELLDLYDIAERYLEISNPSTPEKILTIGKILGVGKNDCIIDFGSGYGELLALWAENFGISGTGVEIREQACSRAKIKIERRDFSARIEIVCQNASEYRFKEHSFDAALCIGASFIWSGYRQTIQAMKKAVRPGGKLVIGEPYWLKEGAPEDYKKEVGTIHTEYELAQIAREEGFDFEYVVRSSDDDWAAYEAGNWLGFARWIEENPNHPDRQQVIDRLHKIQDDYLKYQREYIGWAIYILNPVKY